MSLTKLSPPNIDNPGEPAAVGTKPKDRRRPGRPDTVSEALLPLLRGEVHEHPQLEPLLDSDPEDDHALRGIAVGVIISTGLWALIGGVAWLAVRLR